MENILQQRLADPRRLLIVRIWDNNLTVKPRFTLRAHSETLIISNIILGNRLPAIDAPVGEGPINPITVPRMLYKISYFSTFLLLNLVGLTWKYIFDRLVLFS